MDPGWVRQRFRQILKQQGDRASQSPALHDLYEKAKYLLVVTADDVILGAEWDGADAWQSLEVELYDQRIGGKRFFELLNDPSHGGQDLLEVFYLCLGVGFRGKYLARQQDELAEMQQDIWMKLTEVPRDLTARISPQAYEHTQERDLTKMPAVNAVRLAAVLLGLVSLFVVGAKLVYEAGIEDVTAKAKLIGAPDEHDKKPENQR